MYRLFGTKLEGQEENADHTEYDKQAQNEELHLIA